MAHGSAGPLEGLFAGRRARPRVHAARACWQRAGGVPPCRPARRLQPCARKLEWRESAGPGAVCAISI